MVLHRTIDRNMKDSLIAYNKYNLYEKEMYKIENYYILLEMLIIQNLF